MCCLEQACNWNVTTPFFSLEVTSVHLQIMHSNPLRPSRTSSLRAAPEITTRGSIDLVSRGYQADPSLGIQGQVTKLTLHGQASTIRMPRSYLGCKLALLHRVREGTSIYHLFRIPTNLSCHRSLRGPGNFSGRTCSNTSFPEHWSGQQNLPRETVLNACKPS